jgi:phage FluMu gp28-like protein
MKFSPLFGPAKAPRQPVTACDSLGQPVAAGCDSLSQPGPATQLISTHLNSSQAISAENAFFNRNWFLSTQSAWLYDNWPLKIWEKSRQVGATITDSLHSVLIASVAGARFDVWVTSRDEVQANLYLDDAREWAKILHLAAADLGWIILDRRNNFSARVLEFANGRRIYCLSSNPNALAGKRGHVKIDEFALHEDQRLLYRIAKPVTQWGGTLSIISTHRGHNTLFNQIITDIKHNGNPMGWHLYSYPIQTAVEEGVVERINEKSARNETREEFLTRIRAECIDEEQWLQEYCCTPSDENSAFITHDMITACEDPHLRLRSFDELAKLLSSSSSNSSRSLYIGVDVARKNNLCVIDVGEKIGDVVWDRCRIELQNRTFSEIEFELFRLLDLRQVKRACIDATGMGAQLAERATERSGWKVEPVTFTNAVKEELAFGLRRDFEDRNLRIVRDDKLRSDLRALKKQVTSSGNIRFDGQVENSHCDRTWAMALRQHAARIRNEIGAMVG